jgi:uncharacterized protein (DUF342 family)
MINVIRQGIIMEDISKYVDVRISSDKMKAYVNVQPIPDEKILSFHEMMNILKKKEVVHGINEDHLNYIINKKIFEREIMIAEGTYPVDGTDGRIEFYFNTKKDGKPVILEDGRVDFRNLGLIENVKKSQNLCLVIPPLPGKNGKTVTGEVVPYKEGKQVRPPIGRNVEFYAESNSVIALMDGQVIYSNGKINVYPSHEIPGDIDNSTGNISFIGNLIIKGNVLSGFQVEVGGNVEIWGVVEGATIKAGGDITIRRGVQGNSKAHIVSEGNVFARYIEHSSIEAKEDIKAEVIMHSSIKCGGKLELLGKKGLLVGGNIKVGKEIIVKTIGSQLSTITEIEVGITPELRETYKAIKQEIDKLEDNLKKTGLIINMLMKLKDSNKLTKDKAELLNRSLITKQSYTSKISQLTDEFETIEKQIDMEKDSKIKCSGVIYPGTKITIGPAVLVVKEDLHYCTLYRDGMNIKITPLR